MTTIIEAQSLSKVYPSSPEPAVDAVDFSIDDGECYGFLGPNGAGKTTTMRMISCRARRSSGSLSVFGLDPSAEERNIKRAIGVVQQETNLDGLMNVRENLTLHGRYFDLPKAVARERADELLRFVDLEDRASWNINVLSGGMQRRLLIARALVNTPRILILDEPTTGLDPQAKHHVWERLRELKRRGVTLVITTHYMEEATQLCDRLVIMHQGKILVEGSPRDLIADHLPPAVLELSAADAASLEALADELGPFALDREIVGDRLILYTEDGEKLLKEANEARTDYEAAVLRQATLEDVFLTLTGRTLDV